MACDLLRGPASSAAAHGPSRAGALSWWQDPGVKSSPGKCSLLPCWSKIWKLSGRTTKPAVLHESARSILAFEKGNLVVENQGGRDSQQEGDVGGGVLQGRRGPRAHPSPASPEQGHPEGISRPSMRGTLWKGQTPLPSTGGLGFRGLLSSGAAPESHLCHWEPPGVSKNPRV